MSAKIRTFVAVDVGPGVRQSIGREMPRLQSAAPHFSWVRTQNFHFTLSFLGDVLDRELPEICRTIQAAVQPIEEFELEILGLNPFPSSERLKYIWAGVGHGREDLCRLQGAVADAALRLGFPRDRDIYTPHLTIARAARNAEPDTEILAALGPLRERSFGVCSIDEVIVYSSVRDRQGSIYVPISTIGLR